MIRYISEFNSENKNTQYTDVLIIGAGIAGLYTALMLPKELNIVILSKNSYKETNSYRAQGGIACVTNEKEDSIKKHFVDTLICGKKQNNIDAVKTLVKEARQNVDRLIELGVKFDKEKNGLYSLGKEGAHSANRILHCGDYTGKSIMDTLYKEIKNRKNIILKENAFAIDIITEGATCFGALYEIDNTKNIYFSQKTIVATGGIGKVFNRTTNTASSTGDGIAMVKRAGGILRNMSYIQYHPTVFFDIRDNNEVFLISEAVRGEGARIRNTNGKTIMTKVHPLKDLAPRDIVSKQIFKVIENEKNSYVLLDATMHDRETLEKRFPYIFGKCMENGYDLSKDNIPIIPMMHYFMGGIDVNINGQTNIKNLYACGECAHTGVHGANRLASNSLLEAIVFGNKIASHISMSINTTKENYNMEKCFNDKCYGVNKQIVDDLGLELNKLFNTVDKRNYLTKFKEKYKQLHFEKISINNRQEIEYINMYIVIEEIIKAVIQEEQTYVIGAAN